ncbi:YxeA family protein [Lactococcus garvieae]|uniref:YxeA family protein n=1 Tax=Lactococcus garvieae DCC43 TaxID=1231377 RepID=K2QFN2_9LACT|nr:YxeA family protein [Lactococcus garvieae]EKF52317.1 hypothetical protein C426_0199 [Lactococcus garvieae DCC43]QPS70496.1 YxeA family protein [Lactococcus garvieae]
MKKRLLLVIVGVLFMDIGYFWYSFNHGHLSYFVSLQKNEEVEISKDEGKANAELYTYKVKGYSSKGVEKDIELKSREKLKSEVYLEVLYDRKKGVVSWKERTRYEVPKTALKHLK